MNRRSLLLAASFAAALALTAAARAAAAKDEPASPDSGAPSASADASGSAALVDRVAAEPLDDKRFKAYLKRREAELKEQDKARQEFSEKEAKLWDDFWSKVLDERKVFEQRLVDATKAFFESLASLDPSSHAAAISEFKKLQNNVVSSFEADEQRKRDDFLSARAKRWGDFLAQQQSQTDAFVAGAPNDWDATGPNPPPAAVATTAPSAAPEAAAPAAAPAATRPPRARPSAPEGEVIPPTAKEVTKWSSQAEEEPSSEAAEPEARPKPKKRVAHARKPQPRKPKAEPAPQPAEQQAASEAERRPEHEPELSFDAQEKVPGVALTGRVTSTQEGPMEGVLVTVHRGDDPITTTVITDHSGVYSFPHSRLKPGHYTLQVRAATYDLENPVEFDLTNEATVTQDLKLTKLQYYSDQLTSADWILSVPGMEKQVRVTRVCVTCHTLERVVKSQATPKEFEKIIWRMEGVYDYPSSDDGPVAIPPGTTLAQLPDPDYLRRTAEFLSSIDMGPSGQFKYPLRVLPRPTGLATRAIITEYTLPREGALPNDVAVDEKGDVWYVDLAKPYVGVLDPRTGKTREWKMPIFRPGFNAGSYYMQRDKYGMIWAARYRQNGITRFDPKTHSMESWSVPPEYANNGARTKVLDATHQDVDGKVWFDSASTAPYVARLDLKTNKVEIFDPFHPRVHTSSDRRVRDWELDPSAGSHYIYGLATDSHNNCYVTDLFDSSIARIDAKTGAVKWFYMPTPNSGPRRATMDSQDRLWYAAWGVNKIGMFDTKTETFKEWPIPLPYSNPWMVVMDKNGELWGAGRHNDRVTRLDPKTGRFIQYLLPDHRQTHGSFVDNRTTPVTYWGVSVQMHTIFKVEPLE